MFFVLVHTGAHYMNYYRLSLANKLDLQEVVLTAKQFGFSPIWPLFADWLYSTRRRTTNYSWLGVFDRSWRNWTFVVAHYGFHVCFLFVVAGFTQRRDPKEGRRSGWFRSFCGRPPDRAGRNLPGAKRIRQDAWSGWSSGNESQLPTANRCRSCSGDG